MNTHKNARLTFVRRLEMVRQMTEQLFTRANRAQVAGPVSGRWNCRAGRCEFEAQMQPQGNQSCKGSGHR